MSDLKTNVTLNYSNVAVSTQTNLRKEFLKLQNDFSLNILYIRASKFIKCTCYNNLYKSGDANCPMCFGRGYLNSIQMVRAIKGAASYEQVGKIISQIGVITKDNELVYMANEVVPNISDLIVVTKYNSDNEPVEAHSVFDVQTAIPVHGDHGRIEFYAVVTKIRSDKQKAVNKMIKGLDKKAKVYLSKGMRYKCYLPKK